MAGLGLEGTPAGARSRPSPPGTARPPPRSWSRRRLAKSTLRGRVDKDPRRPECRHLRHVAGARRDRGRANVRHRRNGRQPARRHRAFVQYAGVVDRGICPDAVRDHRDLRVSVERLPAHRAERGSHRIPQDVRGVGRDRRDLPVPALALRRRSPPGLCQHDRDHDPWLAKSRPSA